MHLTIDFYGQDRHFLSSGEKSDDVRSCILRNFLSFTVPKYRILGKVWTYKIFIPGGVGKNPNY